MSRASRREAFTLQELLVSAVILAVLIVLLVGLADGASKLWRNREMRRDAIREVRAGLECISEDLHSAVLTTNSETLVIEPEAEQGGDRLFLLVSQPGEKGEPGSAGDLSAVGYFVASDPKESGSRNLYRFQESGRSVTDAFQSGHLGELYASASPDNTRTTDILARHIARLDVRRIQESFPHPSNVSGLLLISLSAIGGESSRLNSSDSATNEARERNERILKQHLQRYSTFVRLPAEREISAEP